MLQRRAHVRLSREISVGIERSVNLALSMRSAAARILACSRPSVRPCCEDDNFALFRQLRRDRYYECGPGSERPCDKSEWSPTASSLLSVFIAALRSGRTVQFIASIVAQSRNPNLLLRESDQPVQIGGQGWRESAGHACEKGACEVVPRPGHVPDLVLLQ